MDTLPRQLLDVATDAARAAGALLRDRWLTPRQVVKKGFRDLVTADDFAAQALITARIHAAYPDHGFLAEEEDASLADSGPVTWLIDPIDGTSNYSRRIPLFCVSIAAARNGVVLAGVVYDPMRDELFSAGLAGDAEVNNRPVHAAASANLADALFALDLARDPQTRTALLAWLGAMGNQVHSVRAIGSAALALAWVGAGRLDGFVNVSAAPWDIAAGGLIATRAGALVTDPAGTPWSPAAPRRGCVAGTPGCHAPLLSALQQQLGLAE